MRGLSIVIGVLVIVAAMVGYRPVTKWLHRPAKQEKASSVPEQPAVTLAAGVKDGLRVAPEALRRLGVEVTAAAPAQVRETLTLSGTLGLDPTRLQEIRTRFLGEVVELGKTADGARTLQPSDPVKQGQLLAVLWSSELGEKKSDLIDALTQLDVDTVRLNNLEKIYRDGAVPEREYRDAARTVESDANTVASIQRTLQIWRVSDEEIAAVKAEAERLISEKASRGEASDTDWGWFEVRAAFDGALLEFNVAVGDVAAAEDVLFKVGDLSRLQVVALAYEEDLPRLDSLPADKRTWSISVPAAPDLPPQSGAIDRLGEVVDPVQHTVAVMGWVDNRRGLLRAGQFATAAVAMPAPEGEVAVPADSVIERGGERVIFVQSGEEPLFIRRRVEVTRVVGDIACIRSEITDAANSGIQGLAVGERVVSSGAVELEQSFFDLQAAKPKAAPGEGGEE